MVHPERTSGNMNFAGVGDLKPVEDLDVGSGPEESGLWVI